MIFAFSSLAIALSARLGGLGPGLFATALGALLTLYWFIEPRGSFAISSSQGLGEVCSFIITGGLLSLITHAMHHSKRQAGEQADRFRTLFERAAIGNALLDPATGQFTLVNRKFCEITGYDEPALRGMTFRHLTYPEDRAASEECYGRLLRGEIAEYTAERRYVRKDGRVIWVELLITMGRADGQHPQVIASIQDITRRKQMEEALRESEARFRQVIRSAGSVIIGVDMAGRLTLYNGQAQEIFGYTEKEVLGRHVVGTIVPPRDSEGRDMHALVSDLLRHNKKYLYHENENMTRDGRRLWMAWTNRPILESDGCVRELICVGLDLTARKQAEALQHERSFLRQVIDATPSMVFVKDWAGRFILANEAMAHCYGTSVQEIVGKTDADFNASAEELEQFWRDDHQVISLRQQMLIPEERVTFANGELHWFSTIKVPLLNEDGSCDKLLGVASDITARKRAEQALRLANAQLREADRRKDEFLAMLAHELRNPLAPIRNAVQILHMIGPRDPGFQRQHGIIARQVNHMARLLEDLLDVSRITRGMVVLQKQALNLANVLTHALETTTPLIEARRHTLHVALPPEAVYVEGDIDRLAQVIGNLLVNAAKYTDEGGQIWLKSWGEEGQAVVSVRDSGMGIAPEMLPQIFELFAQADQSLARSRGGLGIGLTMVKKLVGMHGGTVEARSAGLGQGSEFIVRLPALSALAQVA